MSLIRAIFAFGNGREGGQQRFRLPSVPSLCLRSASTLASLPEAKKEGSQEQGKNRSPLTNPTKDRAVKGLRIENIPCCYRGNAMKEIHNVPCR